MSGARCLTRTGGLRAGAQAVGLGRALRVAWALVWAQFTVRCVQPVVTFSFLPEALCDLAQKGYKGCYMGRGSEPLNCKEKCECHLVCLDINEFRIQDN